MGSPVSSLLMVLGLWFGLTFFCCAGGKSFEADRRASAAPIIVSAPVLAADYEANEIAADEKYKGRKVQVTGIITAIAKDILDTKYVTLSNGKDFSITSVQCYFDDTEGQYLAALTKDRSLTVECRCDGKMLNVLLKDCVIKAVGN